MDIEFHYYVTYLTAIKAGYDSDSAYKIAYSAQYVDDNILGFKIDGDEEYENYISQTYNILKPQDKLQRIYPLFHFIPGDVELYSEKLAEDCPSLTTTPGSSYANKMLEGALDSDDLYRIGLAAHAYLDSWAHQNFLGISHSYNSFKKGTLINRIVNVISRYFTKKIDICHCNAGPLPDRAGKSWKDERLSDPEIYNNDRFLEAVKKLYNKLSEHNNQEVKIEERNQLINDINKIITEQNSRADRIEKYKKLAAKTDYLGTEMPDYNRYAWFNSSISGKYPARYKIRIFYFSYNPKNDIYNARTYSWDNPEKYQETDWFKFQEAVKAHQGMMTDILSEVISEVEELEKW